MSDDDDGAAAPAKAKATPKTQRKRDSRGKPSPRSTLTVQGNRWEDNGCEWWEDDEEVEAGPDAGSVSMRFAVTEGYLREEITKGLKGFGHWADGEGVGARCDRGRYGLDHTPITTPVTTTNGHDA